MDKISSLRRLYRFARELEWISSLGEAVGRVGIIGSLVVSGGTVIAAVVEGWPLPLLILAGLAAAVMVLFLVAAGRAALRGGVVEAAAKPLASNGKTPMVDSSKKFFHNERVLLHDLLIPERPPVISDRIFDNCTIVGPAVIVSLDENHFDRVKIADAASIEEALFLWPPDRTHNFLGIIGLSHCTIRNSQLHRIGIMGPKQVLDGLRVANAPSRPSTPDTAAPPHRPDASEDHET